MLRPWIRPFVGSSCIFTKLSRKITIIWWIEESPPHAVALILDIRKDSKYRHDGMVSIMVSIMACPLQAGQYVLRYFFDRNGICPLKVFSSHKGTVEKVLYYYKYYGSTQSAQLFAKEENRLLYSRMTTCPKPSATGGYHWWTQAEANQKSTRQVRLHECMISVSTRA